MKRLAVLIVAAGCTHSQPQQKVAPLPAAQSRAAAAETRPPKSPDLRRELMGWVVLRDGAPIAEALGKVARAPGDAGTQTAENTVKMLVARQLGLDPRLADALDLKRPMAVGVLDPSRLGGAPAHPVLALLPVQSRAAVEEAVRAAGLTVQDLGWGIGVATEGGALFAAFHDGYAAIAWRPELVSAARELLAAPLAARAEAPLRAHLDFNNLYAAYGRELEASLEHFVRATQERGDPQLAFAMRSAMRLVHFADSVSGIDVLLSSDASGVTVTARLDGKPNGAWAGYVANQQPRPTWGARFIPRDAVLVYMTNRSTGAIAEELESQVAYLGDASSPPASAALRAAWRAALSRAAAEMAGEVAYAVWPGDGGGVGLGGAYRVRSAAAARRELGAVYRRIGAHLAGVVMRALELDPQRYPVRVAVRPVSLALDGGGAAQAEAVTLSVRWPRGADAERKLFERLFGRELVLATAVAGDTAVFALGRGWKDRLAALVTTARGGALPSLADDARFGRALAAAPEGRISFTYLPTAEMAQFIGRLVQEGRILDAGQTESMQPILEAAGDGAIVSETHVAAGRYQFTTHLPASSLPGFTRIGMVLWRIALSPLLNPPSMPPLPIPPAQVTPQIRHPRAPRTTSSRESNRTL